jgi:methylated-DNA-protein-cysteine methyltransferase related protein
MTPFTARVIAIIQAIPEGKVMTYGGVARAAGSPRAARQVVRILHSMSRKYKLPWHRVVNAKGRIALDDESGSLQKLYLLGEGVHFEDNGGIDLERFQFHPQPDPEDQLLPPLT